MKLTNNLYSYACAELPSGDLQMRIGKPDKDQSRYFRENEKFVGSGFMRIIQNKVLIDGLGSLRTYRATADSKGIPQSEFVGLHTVASHALRIMPMMDVKISYQGNLIGAYYYVAGGGFG